MRELGEVRHGHHVIDLPRIALRRDVERRLRERGLERHDLLRAGGRSIDRDTLADTASNR